MSPIEFDNADLDRFMSVALKLVHEAGQMIVQALDDRNTVDDKTANALEGHSSSILTDTDTAVEKLLISGLATQFPDHRFIGEESMSEAASGELESFSHKPTWIIDPIDGTMNFVHTNPLVCTSVALAINRKIVLGIVNNPVTQSCYTAIKGRGAFLNGQKSLKTSGIQDLSKAMVLMELPTGANDEKRQVALHNVSTFMEKAHAIRCPGPAALDIAWVGSGAADAFFHSGIHVWDMAAGALIVTEAGGGVLDVSGEEFDMMSRRIVCGATKELAQEMAALVKIYVALPRDFSESCPM
eukprot:maker-scaffold4015_size6909-snap-gene-0.5 protein:Tk04136 transcript:maker-scaffold4015_size6909-snap-gene-0.5-mRNA-1 annotation:"inositol monophosphatase"